MPKDLNYAPRRSKYASTPAVFETPKELQQQVLKYLEWAERQNSARIQEYCPACGRLKKKRSTAKRCSTCGEPWDRREVIGPVVRPTLYGFAAFIGTTGPTLSDYAKREGFSDVISWFKTILQADLEQTLLDPATRNVQGPKFVAINNYGWADRQEISGKDGGPIEVLDIRKRIIERLAKGQE